jgi:hypothetical protein
MTTLFDLPREIRDEIYNLVLNLELPPPQPPDELRKDRQDARGIKEWPYNNYYSVASIPVSSASLLQASRQVRYEAEEVLNIMRATQ